MIQIESVHIEELRGIRDLTLNLDRKRYAVSGPNGSGKSGVVDAIEFGLTGNMTRLKGKGTADIKLSEHGPHVEKRDYPDAAKVILEIYIPELDKKATIIRKIKNPNKPTIKPNDDDVISVLKEVESHSEITLTRREIIKYILAEATQRSSDVQTLLKLDNITNTRSALNSCFKKIAAKHKTTSAQVQTARNSLQRHLDVQKLVFDQILPIINKYRAVLNLAPIEELKRETDFSEGIAKSNGSSQSKLNKESAINDLKAILAILNDGLEEAEKKAISAIVEQVSKIESDPTLLKLIRQRTLIELGMELIDETQCPLCDEEWDLEDLKDHLKLKLEKSELAEETKKSILQYGLAISKKIALFQEIIVAIIKLSNHEKMDSLSTDLATWKSDLTTFSHSLTSFDGIMANKEAIASFSLASAKLKKDVDKLHEKISALPDQSSSDDAKTFLTIAQDRLKAYQNAKREDAQTGQFAEKAKLVYKTYCDQAEEKLQLLYDEVEQDFSSYYQQINKDDEGDFVAKLEPAEGKLGLKVDFYKKGMFPPNAYHSEGHQDGMGLCLYLALMKKVLGDKFKFAVLDDVVMSVDQLHRKQFCKLLKNEFPDTQFIITTHDKVWAQQMRSEGLVSAKSSMEFHSWSVDTGPIVASSEIWIKIQEDIDKSDISSAAAKLRRYLEYTSREIADALRAPVSFKSDGNYDLGGLFPSIMSRQKALLSKAAEAAQSWKDIDAEKRVMALKEARSEAAKEHEGEHWVVNKAIHFNDWASFSKEDFLPVVSAFRNVLETFRCSKPSCDSWLYVDGKPESLRCVCTAINLNLSKKS